MGRPKTPRKPRAEEIAKQSYAAKGWQDRFLDMLRNTANVRASAIAAEVSRVQVYRWAKEHPEFQAQWDQALEEAVDTLEAAAWQRARDGVQEPVYQGGKLVGTIRRYSDTLLIVLLKANRPDKYKERQATELTGKDGGPILVQPAPDLSTLTDEELRSLEQLLDKAKVGGYLGDGSSSPDPSGY